MEIKRGVYYLIPHDKIVLVFDAYVTRFFYKEPKTTLVVVFYDGNPNIWPYFYCDITEKEEKLEETFYYLGRY